MRPDIGLQAQFRKKKPPVTYRYDSSLDPQLSWDINADRERAEALIETARTAKSLEEAHAAAYLPTATGQLTIEGWIPVKYYRLPVTVSLAWNGRPVASFHVDSESFRHSLRVERGSTSAWGELTISSSHSFVPDEQVSNGDLRRLSVRIYELGLEALDPGVGSSAVDPQKKRYSSQMSSAPTPTSTR
jgi:hypothetical protein